MTARALVTAVVRAGALLFAAQAVQGVVTGLLLEHEQSRQAAQFGFPAVEGFSRALWIGYGVDLIACVCLFAWAPRLSGIHGRADLDGGEALLHACACVVAAGCLHSCAKAIASAVVILNRPAPPADGSLGIWTNFAASPSVVRPLVEAILYLGVAGILLVGPGRVRAALARFARRKVPAPTPVDSVVR